MNCSILNVRVDYVDLNQALQKIREFLGSNKQHKIFTPNPEMLVDAQKDNYFREVLNSGDLNICDGKGIALFSRGRLKRIPGTDFMVEICKIAGQEGKSVYLLGAGDENVIKQASKKLNELFPSLRVVGFNPGPKITINNEQLKINKEQNDTIVDDIITKAPDVLFVAFGHNKQEKWIHEYLKDLPSVKVAMGVGGAFDYLSGKTKRAPRFIRKIGLEWLYRLITQPHRVRRIFTAVVVFPFLVLKNFIKLQKIT
jgi:N-acetylglucosaminyldiphosphoundecaprenol N-acetyl-beta-D-mannosaminyltransferase